jgi:prolyl-tRNA synthetase
MRTRLFLRTAEFFWHEGHNAFEDHEGADHDCRHIMGLYEKFFTDYLAFDGYVGIKTPEETFPGANRTYAFEAMMQDGKALQAATTHDLGTTFAKTFNITYQGRDEKEHLCHTTSWAFSTRTIGGLIMMHGDDDGMMMPPRIAPQQIIILPVVKDDNAEAVEAFCEKIGAQLKEKGFRIKVDNRDLRTPDKMWDAVKKGVPIRVEVGGREMEAGELTYVRRDIGRESKTTLSVDDFINQTQSILDDIHDTMLERTRKFRDENTHDVSSVNEIEEFFKAGKIGFTRAPVSILEDPALEKVMKDYALSTRNMPLADNGEKVLISKAY